MAATAPQIGLPNPPGGKVYIVTEKALGDLKKKVEPLIRLEVGPGLKLIRGDSVWRVELDLIAEADASSGASGTYALKSVTICENDSPVTYQFLVRL